MEVTFNKSTQQFLQLYVLQLEELIAYLLQQTTSNQNGYQQLLLMYVFLILLPPSGFLWNF